MAPSKKRTTSVETAANFFQRGKKPTTTQRVVTAKKALAPAVVAPTPAVGSKQTHEDEEKEEEDQIDNADYSEEEQAAPNSDQEDNSEVEDEVDALIDDEIESDEDSDAVPAAVDLKPAEKSTPLRESAGINRANKKATTEVAKPGKVIATHSTKKSSKKEAYVAPYVGDIHAGFHQADLSDAEKTLRQFDLAAKYGPCTELTRLERWERAFELGLEPPQGVKDMLDAHMTLNTPLFEGRV
ncbi:hypothetical protein EDD11_002942 [Mortierella claussenii]|nr:hypothetical protein EDD11_002942 [Mortierella claussenii]